MPRTTMVTVGAAAAAVVTGAIVLAGPALGAGSSTSHTQRFTAVETSSVSTSHRSYVVADKDVRGSKRIGDDVLYCFASRTSSTCRVAAAEKGGMLYARFVLTDSTGALAGKVTGGTNSFAHAKGTISGQAESKTKVRITLKYTK